MTGVDRESRPTNHVSEAPASLPVERLRQLAKDKPHVPFICLQDEDQRIFSINFGSFYQMVVRAKSRLDASKIQPGEIVAVCMESNYKVPVCLLALWSLGATYMFIDPKTTPCRLKEIFGKGAPKYIIFDHEEPTLPDEYESITLLQITNDVVEPGPAENWSYPELTTMRSGPNDIVCHFSSSGSSGVPKRIGVAIHGLSERMLSSGSRMHTEKQDCFLGLAPFSFDASLYQFFFALYNECRLFLAPPAARQDSVELSNLFKQAYDAGFPITIAAFLPSNLKEQSGPHALPGLTKVILFGESFDCSWLQPWFNNMIKFYNGYGPTETLIASVVQHIRSFSLPPPMTDVLAGVKQYILVTTETYNDQTKRLYLAAFEEETKKNTLEEIGCYKKNLLPDGKFKKDQENNFIFQPDHNQLIKTDEQAVYDALAARPDGIYISGLGLGCYINPDAEQQKSFFEVAERLPNGTTRSLRLYDSMDIAKVSEVTIDNVTTLEVVFVSRRDRMVKISGNRVSLSYLEHLMGKNADDVFHTLAIVQDPAKKSIHGFYELKKGVTRAQYEAALDRGRSLLNESNIPPMARPQQHHLLSRFPTNAHGKFIKKYADLCAVTTDVPPASDDESNTSEVVSDNRLTSNGNRDKLKAVWTYLTGDNPYITNTTTFSELGGDSSAWIRMASLAWYSIVGSDYHRPATLHVSLLNKNFIETLKILEAYRNPEPIPLNQAGSLPALFILTQQQPKTLQSPEILDRISEWDLSFRIYAISINDLESLKSHPDISLIEKIKHIQKEGPYLLWSDSDIKPPQLKLAVNALRRHNHEVKCATGFMLESNAEMRDKLKKKWNTLHENQLTAQLQRIKEQEKSDTPTTVTTLNPFIADVGARTVTTNTATLFNVLETFSTQHASKCLIVEGGVGSGKSFFARQFLQRKEASKTIYLYVDANEFSDEKPLLKYLAKQGFSKQTIELLLAKNIVVFFDHLRPHQFQNLQTFLSNNSMHNNKKAKAVILARPIPASLPLTMNVEYRRIFIQPYPTELLKRLLISQQHDADKSEQCLQKCEAWNLPLTPGIVLDLATSVTNDRTKWLMDWLNQRGFTGKIDDLLEYINTFIAYRRIHKAGRGVFSTREDSLNFMSCFLERQASSLLEIKLHTHPFYPIISMFSSEPNADYLFKIPSWLRGMSQTTRTNAPQSLPPHLALYRNPGLTRRDRELFDILQENPGSTPIFLFPPLSGHIPHAYLELAQSIGPRQTIIAFKMPAYSGYTDSGTPLVEIGKHYERIVKIFLPKGPYIFVGWSFGTPIGLATTEALGQEVQVFINIDSNTPSTVTSMLKPAGTSREMANSVTSATTREQILVARLGHVINVFVQQYINDVDNNFDIENEVKAPSNPQGREDLNQYFERAKKAIKRLFANQSLTTFLAHLHTAYHNTIRQHDYLLSIMHTQRKFKIVNWVEYIAMATHHTLDANREFSEWEQHQADNLAGASRESNKYAGDHFTWANNEVNILSSTSSSTACFSGNVLTSIKQKVTALQSLANPSSFADRVNAHLLNYSQLPVQQNTFTLMATEGSNGPTTNVLQKLLGTFSVISSSREDVHYQKILQLEGGSGTGKSVLLQTIARSLAKQYINRLKNNPSHLPYLWVPLYIDLGSAPRITLEQALLARNFSLKEYNTQAATTNFCFVLLLDGVERIPKGEDIFTHLNLPTNLANFFIITSVNTEALPADINPKQLTETPDQKPCQLKLAPLSDDSVELFYFNAAKTLGETDKDKSERLRNRYLNFRALGMPMSTPLLLILYLEYFQTLDDQVAFIPNQRHARYFIYQQVIQTRCHNVFERLARRQDVINIREKELTRLFEQFCMILSYNDFSQRDAIKQLAHHAGEDPLTKAFLATGIVRLVDSNIVFTHDTYAAFFFANLFIKSTVGSHRDSTLATQLLQTAHLTKNVAIFFMKEAILAISPDVRESIKAFLLEQILASNVSPATGQATLDSVALAASHAMTLLVQVGYKFSNRKIFRNIRIPVSNLVGGVFTNTDFTQAVLPESQIQYLWVSGAKLPDRYTGRLISSSGPLGSITHGIRSIVRINHQEFGITTQSNYFHYYHTNVKNHDSPLADIVGCVRDPNNSDSGLLLLTTKGEIKRFTTSNRSTSLVTSVEVTEPTDIAISPNRLYTIITTRNKLQLYNTRGSGVPDDVSKLAFIDAGTVTALAFHTSNNSSDCGFIIANKISQPGEGNQYFYYMYYFLFDNLNQPTSHQVDFEVNAIAFSQSTRLVVYAGKNSLLYFSSIDNPCRNAFKSSVGSNKVSSLQFFSFADMQLLAVGTGENDIRIFKVGPGFASCIYISPAIAPDPYPVLNAMIHNQDKNDDVIIAGTQSGVLVQQAVGTHLSYPESLPPHNLSSFTACLLSNVNPRLLTLSPTSVTVWHADDLNAEALIENSLPYTAITLNPQGTLTVLTDGENFSFWDINQRHLIIKVNLAKLRFKPVPTEGDKIPPKDQTLTNPGFITCLQFVSEYECAIGTSTGKIIIVALIGTTVTPVALIKVNGEGFTNPSIRQMRLLQDNWLVAEVKESQKAHIFMYRKEQRSQALVTSELMPSQNYPIYRHLTPGGSGCLITITEPSDNHDDACYINFTRFNPDTSAETSSHAFGSKVLISALDYNPNNQRLLTATADGALHLYQNNPRVLTEPPQALMSVSNLPHISRIIFNANNVYTASGCSMTKWKLRGQGPEEGLVPERSTSQLTLCYERQPQNRRHIDDITPTRYSPQAILTRRDHAM